MASNFASGRSALGICDRCGFQYKLRELKSLVIKTKNVNILVCPSCWEEDQPQLSLGLYPVNDPQALRNPRPDTSYYASGNNGEGSRVIQWGWNPVGLFNPLNLPSLVSTLDFAVSVGDVTVTTT